MNTAPPQPGSAAPAAIPRQPGPGRYREVQRSPEFARLRHAQRSFAFPLTLAFTGWYLLYVLLSNYAGGLMARELTGHVNVAFALGLAQFLTTFLIAWWYARYAAARLDPRAEEIRGRMEGGA